MNEDEYYLYEMRERRNDKAASYDKMEECPRCKPFPINKMCDLCKEIEEDNAMSRK